MTTFGRRQRILGFLREQSGLRVAEMAELFAVAEGTVRNDLNILAEARQLTRVRGAAVPADDAPFAARARVNEAAKQWIARWAANPVEDRVSILLDASTTGYHLIPCLQEHHDPPNGARSKPLGFSSRGKAGFSLLLAMLAS